MLSFSNAAPRASVAVASSPVTPPPSALKFTPMSYETLTCTVDDHIATLTVNRPDKLNALNDRTIEELSEAIEDLRSRTDIGGAILTGAGRAFVAGAGIGELQRHGAISAKALAQRGQAVFRRIETSP